MNVTNIFILLLPALLGGVIIWRRPPGVLQQAERVDAWLELQGRESPERTGVFYRFIVKPLAALLRAIGSVVGSTKDDFVRIGVRVALTLYVFGLLLVGLTAFLGAFGGLLIFAGLWVVVFLGFRGLVRRGKAKREQLIREAMQPDIDAWSRLGATKEEREKAIRRMFDNKEGMLSFGIRHHFTGKTRASDGSRIQRECWLQFRINRSISAMEQREREFLRTAYLLYNEGRINWDQWRFCSFAFINGDGKAIVDVWQFQLYEDETGVKNGPTMLRYYAESIGASVDSAINLLMGEIEQSGSEVPAAVKEARSRLRGGGAWLSAEDLHDTVFADNGASGVRLGVLDGSGEVLSYSGEGSLMTIAPPGSGKTQCFVLPNMLSWEGPAVVLDVKGEIYAKTAKWRARNVGPVFKFSPLDPANSQCYNPLEFVRQDPEYVWEDSRFLADMMIVPSGAADPFWENMARDVLTSAIAYICYQHPPAERPMTKVMDLLYGIDWELMVLSLKTNLEVSAMRQMGHALSEMEKKTRDSVLKTAQSSMSAWQGQRIARATAKSDWSPLDLRTGKPTIYICVNPNEIDSLLSLLRVFIAQHIRMLTSELPDHAAPQVLFVLDELPRLKKMPPIDEALNIGRQYKIKLWMFTQSYGQLKEAYPNAEGMLGSCAVRIFMNVPLNDELAQKLSDQLGYRDGPLDASRTKLVEPLELAGPNFRDIALVLATNTKPAKIRKAFAHQDRALLEKMEA